jgi:hypothetical protein
VSEVGGDSAATVNLDEMAATAIALGWYRYCLMKEGVVMLRQAQQDVLEVFLIKSQHALVILHHPLVAEVVQLGGGALLS